MPPEPVRYRSSEEDSGRWHGFGFRQGDIVISTRSKTGTTWLQMICALLVFGSPDLPAPLGELSPWLDWLVTPRDEVYARLAAQRHRRFIKTHTPLDGIPLDPRATYLVAARHPLDMAVSLYHQGDNINRERVRELTGQAGPGRPRKPRQAPHDWLMRWIRADCDPREEMDSLAGIMWHLSDAWARRGEPNVLLVHYQDLCDDLDGEMRRIAGVLGISVPGEAWPALVEAAGFASMRASAGRLIGETGVLRSQSAFFRRGTSGAGAELLSSGDLAEYHERASRLAPPDMLRWLHSPERSHPS